MKWLGRAASASEDGGGPLLYHVYQASVNVARTVLGFRDASVNKQSWMVLALGAYDLDTNEYIFPNWGWWCEGKSLSS